MGSVTPSANTGNENTAVGYQALRNNTSGIINTAGGSSALLSNTTGVGNTANGANTLKNNTIGNANTAGGSSSLLANTSGSYNTATGTGALQGNTTGSQNTAIGGFGLDANTTGSNNTSLGYDADVSTSNLTNATAIGSGAIVNASNKVRIGNNSVTVIEFPVPYTVSSDRRLKENISRSGLGLDFVLKLNPVQYNMKNGNGKTDYGFIAQELVELLGNENVNMVNKDGEYYTVRYNDLIAPLVKAIQEQQAIINTLKSELQEEKYRNGQLKSSYESRLERIEALMGTKAKKD